MCRRLRPGEKHDLQRAGFRSNGCCSRQGRGKIVQHLGQRVMAPQAEPLIPFEPVLIVVDVGKVIPDPPQKGVSQGVELMEHGFVGLVGCGVHGPVRVLIETH
ncbi:MAG: hypothetical protein HP492_03670 [Nitrospira sp.]|nr:hypothetical protein [Nitrospira sp.]